MTTLKSFGTSRPAGTLFKLMEISLVAEDSMKVGDYNELTIACAAQHGLPCGRGESKPGEQQTGDRPPFR
jgi:hypothetical protein